MNGVIRRLLGSSAGRFLLMGFANTVLSYSLFIGLGLVIDPALAYAIAFAVGLVVVTVFSNRVVYRGVDSWRRKLAYLGWYLLIFGLGQGVIWLLNPEGLVDLIVTSGALMVVTIPLTFLGGRIIFRPQPTLPHEPSR